MAPTPFSRLAAVPCQAHDVEAAATLDGQHSFFFRSSVGIVQRISITGLLVSWDGAAGLLDDGTGKIIFRAGEPAKFNSAALGNIIFCVGRIRSLGSEKYLSVEHAQVLKEAGWLTYRKFETALFRKTAAAAVPFPEQHRALRADQKKNDVNEGSDRKDTLFETIKLLDAGDGADIALVIKKLRLEDDSTIQKLIKEGELYEIKPGKIKILE